MRSTQIAGGLLAVLWMAAGTASSMAQGGRLDARPLTHQDIHDYMLPEGTQASGGLYAVGLGQPVYLEALVDLEVMDLTGITWEITEQPMGGTDVLEASPLVSTDPMAPEVPIYEPKDRELYQLAGRSMLRPTTTGQYTVMATVTLGGDPAPDPIVLELVVTAGTYMGVETCAMCHSGGDRAPDKHGAWSMTGHATMFTEAIDGHKSSHYNSGCTDCHVLGEDTNPLAVNGGFDDVATEVGWTFPTELVPGNWDAMDPKLQNLANIQCENCHGAGSEHVISAVFNPTDVEAAKDLIHVNYSSGDCAQCHSEEPYHVFPLQWENSKHSIGYQRESSSCASCHNGIGAIDKMNGDPVRRDAGSINCATCHDPHDATNPHQIRSLADVTLKDTSAPGGATVITEGGKGKLCMQCHISRRDAVTYVETDNPSSHFGPHHGPQADMFVGANAITYGKDIPSSSAHRKLEDSCVLCHMQETARTSPEHLLAGGHTWKMSWNDGVDDVDLVDACVDCHGDIETFDFPQEDYDGNGIVEGGKTEIKGLLTQLEFLLPPYGETHAEPDPHNLDFKAHSWSRPELKAAYNYLFVVEDGSWGAHNMNYAVGLLKASIADLSINATEDCIADSWQEEHFGPAWVRDPDAAANASPAGDGVPNWLKFLLGLDPHVAGEPVPDGIVWTSGTGVGGGPGGEPIDPGELHIYTAAEVVFATEVGSNYQIEGASELSGGWQSIGDPITGTGAVVSYLTPTRDGTQMFFRVVQSPTPPATP